ncbi:unnamed protein product [Effrenium voratum]|uniref:Uncharacterized protein n=1 Tax=Effrenium voratum TaxID=2562239 RepID=A0AA36JQI4_9DINO|nr:unnamed protein product [Effrenium voratum]
MTQTLERRGSRAWRLSPAADSAQDAEQHRRQRAWRQRNWVPATSDEISDPEAFFKLFCSSCNCFLSDKGLMMQMLANESSICFATEKQPQDIVLQDEAGKTPGVCDCKVRDMACGCGARLGYHLLSACEVCEESGTRQRWFLCPRCVEAEPAEPVDLEATEPVAAPPPALATPRFAADSPPQFGEAAIAAVPLPRILAERDQQAEEPADRSEAELAKREAELTRRERLVTQKEEELKTLESQLQAQASQAQVQQGVPTPCKPVVSRRAERPQAPTPALQTQMTPQLTTQMTPQVSQTPHTQTIPQMTPPQMSQMTQMTHQETPKQPATEADLRKWQAVQREAAEAQQRVQAAEEATFEDTKEPQGRLDFAQRLAEKRRELSRWQRSLEEKSAALEEMEQKLGFSAMSSRSGLRDVAAFAAASAEHFDAAQLAAALGRGAVVGAFGAARLLAAAARPVLGATKVAANAAVAFAVSGYTAAVERSTQEAQDRALQDATSLRRARYYAAAAASPQVRDGCGVPPAPRREFLESPGLSTRGAVGFDRSSPWPSPIYPVSPMPTHGVHGAHGAAGLAPVMEPPPNRRAIKVVSVPELG